MFNPKIKEDKTMLPMRRSQNWLPSIFNEFFENDNLNRMASTSPAINIIENEKEYCVELAAPGMSKENFFIRVNEDNHLIVAMEKKEEQKEENKSGRYLRREFSYSKFQQVLVLPENIVKENISATMENGVLQITIPKDTSVPEKPKELQIAIR